MMKVSAREQVLEETRSFIAHEMRHAITPLSICAEMLYELEAFFFQYKSSLDMLVKILCPIMGFDSGQLSTYGNKGTEIIKRLEKLKKRVAKENLSLTLGRIDWLIEEIEKAKSPWLESVIRIRDTFSHYSPEINLSFTWDGVVGRARVPFGGNQESAEPVNLLMKKLTEELIGYSAHFIAVAVSCAIPLETHIQVMDVMEKRYKGARWQMDLSKAIWKLASNVIRDYTEEDIENAKRNANQ